MLINEYFCYLLCTRFVKYQYSSFCITITLVFYISIFLHNERGKLNDLFLTFVDACKCFDLCMIDFR